MLDKLYDVTLAAVQSAAVENIRADRSAPAAGRQSGGDRCGDVAEVADRHDS